MDADGYVSSTGRLKDMIIRGGEKIIPAEIGEFLFTHPKIAQVSVFGIPDDFYGEEVMAWMQLHAGQTATADEIKGVLQGQDGALQDSEIHLVRG
jgi:fatty-acyl-CoA synthase